jgi:phosphoglucomutase
MENYIKKILKEETQYKFIQKVIKHLLRDIKGGAHVPYKSDIISTYGLTQNDLDYLYKIEEEALDRIKGVLFNVRDYIGKVSIGGFDFQFVVQGARDYEHEDFDGNRGWDVGVEIKLEGSTVELMGTGEVVKLEIAVDNPDYGWEIESEMGDVIHDIIYAEEPILAALGASILTERGYEI